MGAPGMSSLHIDLQEGFEDESVIIKVDGREVFNKPNVRTRTQIGRADSVVAEARGRVSDVEVILPEKGRSRSIAVDSEEGSHLGVSVLRDGEIEVRVAREPFGYV